MRVLSCDWFCKALRSEWTVSQLTAAWRPSDCRIHGNLPKMVTQINPCVWNSQCESTFIVQERLLGSLVIIGNAEQHRTVMNYPQDLLCGSTGASFPLYP